MAKIQFQAHHGRATTIEACRAGQALQLVRGNVLKPFRRKSREPIVIALFSSAAGRSVQYWRMVYGLMATMRLGPEASCILGEYLTIDDEGMFMAARDGRRKRYAAAMTDGSAGERVIAQMLRS